MLHVNCFRKRLRFHARLGSLWRFVLTGWEGFTERLHFPGTSDSSRALCRASPAGQKRLGACQERRPRGKMRRLPSKNNEKV